MNADKKKIKADDDEKGKGSVRAATMAYPTDAE